MNDGLFCYKALQHGLDSGSVSWLVCCLPVAVLSLFVVVLGAAFLLEWFPFVAFLSAFGWGRWEWVGRLWWWSIVVWWIRYGCWCCRVLERIGWRLVWLVARLVVPLVVLGLVLPLSFSFLGLAFLEAWLLARWL